MSHEHETCADIDGLARKHGCIVVYPQPDELFIDIDSNESYETYSKGLAVLVKNGLVERAKTSPSKSGGPNRHIVVTLKRPVKDACERIALQALLGSDSMHELLSWIELEKGFRTEPSLFFEPLPTKAYR